MCNFKTTLLTFYIASQILFFSSCRKHNETYEGKFCAGNCFILTGQVIDTPSTSKLADVELNFTWNQPSAILPSPIQLGKTKTDANGNYEFKFDATSFKNGTGYFYISFVKPDFFINPDTQDNHLASFHLDSSNINSPFVQNFTLFKTATLKAHIKTQTVTNFGQLIFGYKFSVTDFQTIINGNRIFDTTFAVITAGDIQTILHWNTYGGFSIQGHDTIVIPAGTEQQINVTL